METRVGVNLLFFAVIIGANSLCFWESAVKTLIYMKMWKTKFPIFGSIRLKMLEPVTYNNIIRSLYIRFYVTGDFARFCIGNLLFLEETL